MSTIGDEVGVFEVKNDDETGVKLVKCRRWNWRSNKEEIYSTFAHGKIKKGSTIVVPCKFNHFDCQAPSSDLRTNNFEITQIETKKGDNICTNYNLFSPDIPRQFYKEGEKYTSKLNTNVDEVCSEGIHFMKAKKQLMDNNHKPSFNYEEYLKSNDD